MSGSCDTGCDITKHSSRFLEPYGRTIQSVGKNRIHDTPIYAPIYPIRCLKLGSLKCGEAGARRSETGDKWVIMMEL